MGIDPGYALTGYGIIECEDSAAFWGRSNRATFSVLDYGCISTEASSPFPQRLLTIQKAVCDLLQIYRPELMAIEEIFFSRNATTAIGAAQARGVIICAAAAAGVEVYEYTPMQVKLAVTGYGRAEKAQLQDMVRRILNLKEAPRPDDAADALAIALCHAQAGNRPEFLAVSGYQYGPHGYKNR